MNDFEQYRRLLFSIAYQMLGSAMEAEDIVQEAYLRYQAAQNVQTPKAYLTTIVTRLCLNHLQAARTRREQYTGTWLPEPVMTTDLAVPMTPSAHVDQHEAISMAFLVLLEQLTPPERAVFLLREVFDYDYAELAAMLGKEESACRQLYSRAKKHLAESRPRFRHTPDQHQALLERFVEVVDGGQVDQLTDLLAHDVMLWADGKGRAGNITRPLQGSKAVAQFVLGVLRFMPPDASVEIAGVNGEPALLIRSQGAPFLVLLAEFDTESRVHTIRVVASPEKLRHL